MIITRKGYEILIDDEDLEKVKNTKFQVNIRKDYGYVRLILNTGKPFGSIFFPEYDSKIHEIDHINRLPLDNRKENLRLVSHQENLCNKGLYRNNKSGYKGVSIENNRWRAECYFMGKRNRKWFGTKEEAILAYNEMAKEMHGKFAVLNIIK